MVRTASVGLCVCLGARIFNRACMGLCVCSWPFACMLTDPSPCMCVCARMFLCICRCISATASRANATGEHVFSKKGYNIHGSETVLQWRKRATVQLSNSVHARGYVCG